MTVAVVTGAGRGIGRAVALRLAADGRAVVVTARSADQLADTVRLVQAAGGTAVAVIGDVTDPGTAGRAVSVAEGLGEPDVLVNNAGAAALDPGPLAEADLDSWWRLVEVNLRGPALMARSVLPGMIARGRGRVVDVNSLGGARELPGHSAYSVSKAALMRLTACLAAETAGSGVVVFDLSPGLVRTAMTEGMDLWKDVPDEDWTPVQATADAVALIASGALDALSGRFLHAEDDLADLAARAEQIVAADARVLRLRAYGADDPLA